MGSVIKSYNQFIKKIQPLHRPSPQWIPMKYPIFVNIKTGPTGSPTHYISWNIGNGHFIGGINGIYISNNYLRRSKNKIQNKFALFIRRDYLENILKSGGGIKNGSTQ